MGLARTANEVVLDSWPIVVGYTIKNGGTKMATWNSAGKARTDFADMMESLSSEQLDQPSLCDEWAAKGVLAHVTSFVETNAVAFFAAMVKSRFDFDKTSLIMANKQLVRPVEEVIATLRSKATKSAPLPMFPESLTVADVVIHTQDVRRPLELAGSPSEDLVQATLDFLTTDKMATTLVDRRPIDDVKLVASDMDWSFGIGPEITGSGEALMMGLANRSVLDELQGDGLAAWQ